MLLGCSAPDTAPVGLVVSGAVGGALVVGAILTVILRANGGRAKTPKRDEALDVEMLRLNRTQEEENNTLSDSLDVPFLPHERGRAAAPPDGFLAGDEGQEGHVVDGFEVDGRPG